MHYRQECRLSISWAMGSRPCAAPHDAGSIRHQRNFRNERKMAQRSGGLLDSELALIEPHAELVEGARLRDGVEISKLGFAVFAVVHSSSRRIPWSGCGRADNAEPAYAALPLQARAHPRYSSRAPSSSAASNYAEFSERTHGGPRRTSRGAEPPQHHLLVVSEASSGSRWEGRDLLDFAVIGYSRPPVRRAARSLSSLSAARKSCRSNSTSDGVSIRDVLEISSFRPGRVFKSEPEVLPPPHLNTVHHRTRSDFTRERSV